MMTTGLLGGIATKTPTHREPLLIRIGAGLLRRKIVAVDVLVPDPLQSLTATNLLIADLGMTITPRHENMQCATEKTAAVDILQPLAISTDISQAKILANDLFQLTRFRTQ